MKRKNLLLLAAALVPGTAFSSCVDPGAPSSSDGLRLVILGAESLCDDNEDNLGHEDFKLPIEASSVVIRVANNDHESVERFEAATIRSGRVMLTSIPPGDYGVDVAICDSSGQAQWLGSSEGVAVTANTKSFPSVLLSPVGFGACTAADETLIAGAFASSASDATGAYLLGGLQTFQPGSGGGTASSTTQVRKFSLTDGTVRKIGDLSEARFGAWAEMNGDAVRLFGGAKSLNFSGTTPVLAPSGSPSCAVLDFDTKTGAETCLDTTVTMPAWPSIGKSGSRLVAVGGLEPDGQPSNQVFFLEGDVVTSNTLSSRRFGATVVGLDSATTLVFGGSDNDLSTAALLILEDDGVTQLAYGDADGDGDAEPAPSTLPYLASGSHLGTVGGRQVVLMVGGHEGTIPSKRVSLVVIDGAAGIWEQKTLEPGASDLLFERSAAQLVPIEGGDLVLLGGFSWLQRHPEGPEKCEGQDNQCFRRSTVRFRVNPSTETLEVVDDSLSLAVGALGARATLLSDGAMLVTSGMEDLSSVQLPTRSELLRFPSDLDRLCAP